VLVITEWAVARRGEGVTDLCSRVSVGTKVIVLPMRDRRADLGLAIR
jgi:hypothetical protein